MAVDRAAILTDVAGRLRITEPEAEPAVDMAIEYVANDIGILAPDLPADDLLLNGQGVPYSPSEYSTTRRLSRASNPT